MDKLKQLNLKQNLTAPIKKGDVIGNVIYKIDGEVIGEQNVYALENAPEMTWKELFVRTFKKYCLI